MKLPAQYFKIIINELKGIKELINEATTPDDKLYFFSASFGIINRIMNLHYDPLLVFIHQILQNVHMTMTQRLASAKTGVGGIPNTFPTAFMDSLANNFSELINAFENNDENQIREVLEKFTNLSYATTGNGFYLLLLGKLPI